MDQKNLIVLVAFLQSAAIALGQASLKMNSVAFFQLTKQMQVPLVAIVEFFFIGRVVSVDKCLLLVVMVLGVSVACFNDVQFSAVGAFVAMIGVMSTSVEVVLYSWLQQSQRWETLQLLHQTMPFAASGLIIAAIEVDFLQPRGLGLWNIVLNVLEAFYSLNNNNNNSKNSLVVSGGDHEVGRHHSAELAISQTFFNVTKMSSYATFLFVLSCVLGMLVNVSSCFVGGKASALAYAMLGLTKTITVIYIGVLYFDAPPSLRVIAGGFFAVCAIVVYSIVTIREKQSLQQQKNDGDDMNDVLLLTDEIEVGIEPATISPKMYNHGQRKHGSLRSF
jgi:solute carrier family 35, member E3